MDRKIFITGATGFAGRYLIDLLKVKYPDCAISGTCFPEHPESCDVLDGVELFHLDMRSEEDVSKCIKQVQPEWIFHLAAISNVGYSWANRKETLEANMMGTFYLFEAVRQYAPQSRMLFVSSCDVYGILSPIHEALREDHSTPPVSPYAFSKISGELLSRFYVDIEGLDIVISRSFPHTGPGQSADFVFSDWANQIAQIEKGFIDPVLKVGNLDVRRDYSDVRDVVKAYVVLLERGKKGEIYNVCSGKADSLKDNLDLLLSLSHKNIRVEVDPQKLRKADIPLVMGDNEKLFMATGWKPGIPLEKTLRDLLDYWKEKV
ncbi:MAG: GDP-mannose 4,6-dehydratase [Candidatus Aminicenantes bacterium]|nr:GDP-mannose 4,6-dehydratase [Candidatus Aminicenantes bacterium]